MSYNKKKKEKKSELPPVASNNLEHFLIKVFISTTI